MSGRSRCTRGTAEGDNGASGGASQVKQADADDRRSDAPPRAVTLAQASDAGLDKLLTKAGRRGRGLARDAALRRISQTVSALPRARASQQQRACGALAVTRLDDNGKPQEDEDEDEEKEGAAAEAATTAAAAEAQAMLRINDDDDDEDEEWEDAGAQQQAFQEAEQEGVVLIDDDDDDDDDDDVVVPPPPLPLNSLALSQRTAVAAATKSEISSISRTGVLCMLARALAFDAAADEPAVREAAGELLSSLSEEEKLPLSSSSSPPSREGASIESLRAFASAFSKAVRVGKKGGDGSSATTTTPGGVAVAASALEAAARSRSPASPEEVSPLMVAVLRAAGVPARCVWCFADPPFASSSSSAAVGPAAAAKGKAAASTSSSPRSSTHPSSWRGADNTKKVLGKRGASSPASASPSSSAKRLSPPPSARGASKKADEDAPAAAAAASAPPSSSSDPSRPPPRKIRRGDAELEAQIRMAEEATAAAAAAAAAAKRASGGGASSASAAAPRPPPPPPPPRRPRLLQQQHPKQSQLPPPGPFLTGVWVEAFAAGAWTFVDPRTCGVAGGVARDRAFLLSPLLPDRAGLTGGRAKAPLRAVAVWNGGARCVAARYAPGWGPSSAAGVVGAGGPLTTTATGALSKKRASSAFTIAGEAAWWAETIAALAPRKGSRGVFSDAAAREETRRQQQPMPPTAKGKEKLAGVAAAATAAAAALAAASEAEARDAAADEAAAAEAASRPPASVDAFRSHPALILARFIPRYSGPRVGASPAGAHRGEPYWRRSDVVDLHSVDRWRRMGMELLDGEAGRPAKVVAKRGAGGGGGGGGGSRRNNAKTVSIDSLDEEREGEEEEEEEQERGEGNEAAAGIVLALPQRVDATTGNNESGTTFSASAADAKLRQMEIDRTTTRLYGPWQVRPARPASPTDVAAGIVPGRNAYGSIDVPPLTCALPRGTVHLRGKSVVAAARALGVDAAPAVVGFVGRRGRRLPEVDGAVVLEQHAAAVKAAAAEAEAAKEIAAETKARNEAEAAWRVLLGAALARVRLGEEHGNGEAGGAAADATRRKRTPPRDGDEEGGGGGGGGDGGDDAGGRKRGVEVETI